jgi:hypothetical protein
MRRGEYMRRGLERAVTLSHVFRAVDIRGVDVSVLLGGGECAGNLMSEGQAPASEQANGGCSAVPDPWADLDIPEMLRR